MFTKKVDLRSRKAMTEFLSGHYRYFTASSWNGLSSYAANVKLDRLDIPKELRDKAYDVVCSDVDTFEYDMLVNDLITQFRDETGYTVGFNGRSGGYLVLYSCEKKLDEHKSFCPSCGQRNFQVATDGQDKCGRCGNKLINYTRPLYTYQARVSTIGSNDPLDYEDYSMYELKKEVKLVQRFDKLCDDIRDEFLAMLKSVNIVDEEYHEVKTRKVLEYVA